jgi:hypothetical protein
MSFLFHIVHVQIYCTCLLISFEAQHPKRCKTDNVEDQTKIKKRGYDAKLLSLSTIALLKVFDSKGCSIMYRLLNNINHVSRAKKKTDTVSQATSISPLSPLLLLNTVCISITSRNIKQRPFFKYRIGDILTFGTCLPTRQFIFIGICP